MPKAAGLAAELREEFGVEATLIPGSHGVFDVLVGDRAVFSKSEVGRFPETGEVIAEIKKLGLQQSG